jgi:hypothetical protein
MTDCARAMAYASSTENSKSVTVASERSLPTEIELTNRRRLEMSKYPIRFNQKKAH